MKKFGWNVHSLANREYLARLRPAVFMAFGSSWGHNLGLLREAYQVLGEAATYAYRSWSLDSPGDLDHFEWYLGSHGTNPTHFIEQVERLRDGLQEPALSQHVLWHTFNETGHDRLGEYFEWHARAVNMANQRDLRLLCLNFGVGHPTGSPDEIIQKWKRGEHFFRAVAESPGKSVVGLHEYFPGVWEIDRSWLAERYKRMKCAVSEMGIAQPQIVFTEFGTDLALGANGNHPAVIAHCPGIDSGGWHAYADHCFWEKYYPNHPLNQQAAFAREIITIHQQVYDPDPDVIGTCFFCWGAIQGWERYDLADNNELLNILVEARENPDVPPEPEPQVCDDALAAPRDGLDPTLMYRVKISLNIRTAPVVHTCSQTGQTKAENDIVTALAHITFGGYDWIAIDHNGDECFLAWRRHVDGKEFLEYLGDDQAPVATTWGVRTSNSDLVPLLKTFAEGVPGLEFFQG